MKDSYFEDRVTFGFWLTMVACVAYALAAWVLTR